MKKTKRGGKRPGSGRKPVESPKLTTSLAVSSEVKLYLDSQDNASATVEQLIRCSAGFREFQKSRETD